MDQCTRLCSNPKMLEFVVNISFQVKHYLDRACTKVCQTDVQDGIFS